MRFQIHRLLNQRWMRSWCIHFTFIWLNTLRTRQDGQHVADNIFKCILLNENCCIWFDWNMFARVELTIIYHWFCYWLVAEKTTIHYLNQWWHSLLMHICVSRTQWVNTLNPEPNYFILADSILKHMYVLENVCVLILIQLKHVLLMRNESVINISLLEANLSYELCSHIKLKLNFQSHTTPWDSERNLSISVKWCLFYEHCW